MKRLPVLILMVVLIAMIAAGPLWAAAGGELDTITWYMPSGKPAYFDEVMAEVNDKLALQGLQLDLCPVEQSDYEQRMQLLSSSRGRCDIMWVSSWLNNYANNVSNGALIAIDDYLDDVPALAELLDSYWQYMKVGGKIYGVPVLQIMADEPGLAVRADTVRELGLDLSGIHDFWDLDEVFAEVYASGLYPLTQSNIVVKLEYWDEETESYVYVPHVEDYYMIDPETMTVCDDETRLAYELAYQNKIREWYLAGYIAPDLPTMTDQDALWSANMAFCKYSRVKPGNEAEVLAATGVESIGISMGEALIGMGGVRSTVNAISSSSEHPLEALKLLEIVNTDADIYNTLVFGCEGRDYYWADDTHVERIPGGYSMVAWEIGNQFNAYLTVGQEDGIWEETMALNESAMADPLGDFSFDRSSVETEITNCLAIYDEYNAILIYGLDDPETLIAEREEKLAAAGQQSVIDEINAQLAAWVAAKD